MATVFVIMPEATVSIQMQTATESVITGARRPVMAPEPVMVAAVTMLMQTVTVFATT
ncbi:MAG: hypothetical protein HFH13_04840 [Dorea sp.]|nr:hypothetical protein [Dorea sp.]